MIGTYAMRAWIKNVSLIRMALDGLLVVVVFVFLLAFLPLIAFALAVEFVYSVLSGFLYAKSPAGRLVLRIKNDGPSVFDDSTFSWRGFSKQWFVFDAPKTVSDYHGDTHTIHPVKWSLPSYCLSEGMFLSNPQCKKWRKAFVRSMILGEWRLGDRAYDGGPSILEHAAIHRMWRELSIVMERSDSIPAAGEWRAMMNGGLWQRRSCFKRVVVAMERRCGGGEWLSWAWHETHSINNAVLSHGGAKAVESVEFCLSLLKVVAMRNGQDLPFLASDSSGRVMNSIITRVSLEHELPAAFAPRVSESI